jgi:hypothetical protein
MDAYIFATQATEDAVGALGAGVGSTGPARVVLPLIGSHRLYVAVTGSDGTTLAQRVAAVAATSGLSGVTTFMATTPDPPANLSNGWPPVSFPTFAAVDAAVGFAHVTTLPGLATTVYIAASQVTGVVGAAVVTGASASVLVEATGATADAVAGVLHQVAALPGVTAASTSIGATETGFGFTGI